MAESAPILITGAGQRIGLHCAERLLDEGERLIVSYRTERPAIERLRARGALAIKADFSDEGGILAFIEALHATTDSLRAIVHNASQWLAEDSAAAFRQMFNVHMLAPYLINQHCETLLRAGGPADIVHISDAVTGKGSERHLAYSASKAGMENLTLSFAKRFAPAIKVNTIAPALILFNQDDSEAYRQQALSKSLIGIEPGAEVIYGSLRYLMNNAYVTGTTLTVNGGRHLR